MSKILHVKTLSMLMAAAALCGPAAYAAETEAPAEVPQAQAAASECTGEVVDETGEPLIGATVRVVGTSIAGATDLDGRFSLKGVKVGSQLQVSYIGYNPTTVVWDGKPLAITLQEDTHTLEEVVVMGYGITQKRANVTNSIAKVSEKTLTVGANANPAQALAGAVAGVKVKVTSGDPSATPSIVIRGGTNFDGSGEPVYVVDGQIRSSLSDINPNDIEDMQILKDAGATALYGARAANGVVLITTKNGKAGTASLNLNVKYGLNWYSDTGYDYNNAHDYIYWYRKGVNGTSWAHRYGGTNQLTGNNVPGGIGRTTLDNATQWNIMTMTEDNKYLLNHGWQQMPDPISDATIIYRDINLLNENLNVPCYTQDYNLSFQGGNDKGTYYASLGYYDADGAFKTTFYKRYNFAFTGSYKLAPWLQANSVFNYIRANWDNKPAYGIDVDYYFGRIASVPPTLRILDEDNQPLLGQNTQNTNLNFQSDKYHRDNQSDKFSMTQSLTATIIEGLTVKGSMAWYYNEQLAESFTQDIQTNQQGTSFDTSRSSSASFFRYFDQTYNLLVNFNRTFNQKHDVSAMLGMEYYNRDYKMFSASGNQAPTDYFADLGLTFTGSQNPYKASSRSVDSEHVKERILSYMGRVEYNYDGKYHAAATFREDGYSRLVDNRWGFFPGVSAGWTFSREKFWAENENLAFINYGKLRSSFGLNGVINTQKIGYYTLQGAYSAYRYNSIYGYRISTLPNPGLKWEKTRTFEVGLDFGFLQDRFQLGLTYYNRLTMDKYADLSLPQTTGFSTVVDNNGKFRNQGLEIDINATILRTRDFNWSLGFNLTYNKNKVVALPDNGRARNWQEATEVYDGNKLDEKGNPKTIFIGGLQEGQEPNHIIGYKMSYIIRSEAELAALGDYIDLANSQGNPLYANQAGYDKLVRLGYDSSTFIKLECGDVVYADRNGDNIVDTYDQYDLGNLIARWTGGFNTTLTWKGLSLYARFDMGFDFKVYDSNLAWYLGCGQGSYNQTKEVWDTWTPENPGAKWPRYVWASNYGSDAWIRTTSMLTQNGAYLACRELQLSYSLPQKICNKFYCKGLTISVTGQNLGYIKSCTIPLPDNVTNTDGFTAGWGGTYNLPRTLLFGLNATF